jgi:hypothetical protein
MSAPALDEAVFDTLARIRLQSRGIDPDFVHALDRDRLVIGASGRPLNVQELVDDLIEAKPHAAGTYPPPARKGPRIKSMSPAKRERLRRARRRDGVWMA